MGMGNLMEKAKEMQVKMQAAQEEIMDLQVIGESGGGMVRVIMTGRHDVRKVAISAEAMQESKEALEDLVAAAFNDAVRKVEDETRGKMGNMFEGMDLPKDFQLPTDMGGQAGGEAGA